MPQMIKQGATFVITIKKECIIPQDVDAMQVDMMMA